MRDTKLKKPPLTLGFVPPVAFLAATVLMASTAKAAEAPSAEFAKKCCDMAIKVYPSVRPGSSPGDPQKEREYFQEPSTVGRALKAPSGHKGK
jgi:hypothetical protein